MITNCFQNTIEREQKKIEWNEEFAEWYVTHQTLCQANYDGSSPAIEVEAVERIWRRSETIGFRYTSVISDGDSKTHDRLSSL